ncbi:unnamed protein product [Camellia sinensis]
MSPPALDMENPLKPSIPTDASLSNDGRGASVDAPFAYFCKLEEAEHYWFAFVLYSVKRLSETNADDSSQGTGGDGFTLCQILRVEKLKMMGGLITGIRFFFTGSLHSPSMKSGRVVMKGCKCVVLLASLCNICEISEDELRKTMEKDNDLIEDILKKNQCSASECRSENLENIDTGLLEDTSLSFSLNILENDYADATRNKGELDERVFVKEEDSLLGSGSLSGGAMNISGAKRKIDSIASPARTIISPLAPYCSPSASHAKAIPCGSNSKVKATPVTTAMTTAKWLRTIISPLPPKPLPELERFLSSCDSDVTTDVIRRANIILEAIFPSSGLGEQCITGGLQCTSLMDRIWAEQRRLEALKVIL